MIHRIATILKDRIAAFTYVDKIGGLTRVARQQREGKEIVIPVAGDVDEAYACDPATIRDMVPDDRYGCMVYFEDRGTTRITERTRGTSYRASLRLVCWVNTLKFGSDPTTADRILEQFTNDLNVGQPYNTDTLIGLKHSVEGFPQRGASIFSQYTYPEAERQYLLWPFDAFALDITATYRIKPGCEEAPVPDDDACWTPPVTRKRRNPSEFTCDELLDPVTGLTAAQLGPECLDCEGGGPCPPTTVNGTESDTPTILVQQGGVNVGTLNPATGVHTVPECDPCPPCDPLTVTLAGVEIVNEADPCGVDVALACDDPIDGYVVAGAGDETANGLYLPDGIHDTCTQYRNTLNTDFLLRFHQVNNGGSISADDQVTQYANENGVADCEFVDIGGWISDGLPDPAPTVRQATIGDICATPCECDDVTVQLRDSAGNNIGAPDVYAAGTSTTKTAPDGTIRTTDGLTDVDVVKSNGATNLPKTQVPYKDAANADQLTTAEDTVFSGGTLRPDTVIPRITIYESDGVTVQGYADIGTPFYTVDACPTPSGILYMGGKNNWSGQTTVYRTGDEGTAYANGLFTFTDPSYPTHASRLTDFLTLAANNIHGNTLRFTDRAGSAPATSGDRFIQDHSTGWEYYRLGTLSSALWNAQVDAGVALNATLGETGWVLCPIDLLELIADRSLGTGCINYGGFLMGTSGSIWSSTTVNSVTTDALSFFINSQRPANQAKASINNNALFCRRFAA